MFRFRALLVFGTCLFLSGCATPEQNCISQATLELRTIDALIFETQANLERGFGLQREVVPSVGVNFCAGGFGDTLGVSFCSGNRYVQRDRPVAIDPEAEQRKLDELLERRVALEERSAAAVAACRA